MITLNTVRARIRYWRAKKQLESQKSAVTPSPVIQRVTTAK